MRNAPIIRAWIAAVGCVGAFFSVSIAQQTPPAKPEAGARSVEDWIAQLGDESFPRRVEATEALIAMAEDASAALDAAMESEHPEIRMRARHIRVQALLEPLVGTVWKLTEGEGSTYTIEFLADGRLKDNSPNNTTFDNDRWRVESRADGPPVLVLEVNDAYATKTAPLTGTKVEGEAINVKAHSWKWSAELVESPEE
ncbi:hypothetical protein HAHE_19480 [Haloferula helveola]|uniref:Secreted protein n=1 Tax=Haloferula helveola TaxID=490095 RepID=A0ABM7RK81_9BACT|nr:hypothetical protein HAHE_19480 [Haloferula helveola]